MFYFWITLLLCMSIFINIGVVSAEISQIRFCEPIRIELCKGIGYNLTSFPNLIGHELQTDAEFTLQTFSPLIQYGCSPQLKFFLCSTYTPMCTTKVQDPIGPCRSLCESVRAKCHPVLEGFGFNWPTTLDCSRFPSENNHEHMCMEGDKTSDNVSNRRNNDKSMKIKSGHSNLCEGFYKSHLYVKLNRSGGCVPLCEADILFDAQEKNMAEIWLISWSISALFLAIVATLCLILTNVKCDKILMPLVISHCFITIGWLIRWLAGRNSTACGYEHNIPGTSLLLTHNVAVSTTICIVCFTLRYYFGMASAIWWTIFCYQWNVSLTNLLEEESPRKVAHRTSSRSKDNDFSIVHNKLLYVTAWGIPALQTLIVLFTRYVDADELIGSCFVGNHSGKALLIFVIVPLLSFWVIGSAYLSSAYFKRKKAQKLHVYNLPVHLNGIGTFLFIYAIPCILLISLDFLVYFKRDNWLSSYQPTSEFRTPLWSFVARAVIELLIGVLASSWSIGPRIISLCRCKRNSDMSKSRMNKQPVQKIMSPTYLPCPHQNSFASISRHNSNRRYLSQPHINRKSHAFKTSLQTVNLTNHETIL